MTFQSEFAGLSPFSTGAPLLMGVINVTPDSFSDGGKDLQPEVAIAHGEQLIAEGASILDIGGESTRPEGTPVPVAEEIRRIEPVVKSLAKRFFVSIDTFKAETATCALQLGARMVNDVSALRADPEMTRVVREFDAYIVLMHSKEPGSAPHVSDSSRDYTDVVKEVSSFFEQRIEHCLHAGIRAERIVLDPGMGRFVSHDPKYSWELLRRFHELRERFAAFPLLIGTSRKGFLGGPLAERDAVSQLTAVSAWLRGASVIRTHNVSMAREFVEIVKKMA